jgi:pyridoxamine 5'-phosphate oxidase
LILAQQSAQNRSVAVLREEDLDPDPIRQFHLWHEVAGTDAMVVATATPDGLPSARVVLLKGVDHRGFVFYTSSESAKASDLASNPRAALVFHWPPDHQVRVGGTVQIVSGRETEDYWRTRPRLSQLGAWASHQSRVIAGREVLEDRVAEMLERFGEGEVPCPQSWIGYRVVPSWIEFWRHQEDRLHDRLRYRRAGDGWVIERLSP